MDAFDDIDKELRDVNKGVNVDFYGITGGEPEVDSDVNEDRNRERQLDDSFDAWYLQNIDEWIMETPTDKKEG